MQLRVAGDRDVLTGIYVVGADGVMELPGAPPLRAGGVSTVSLQERAAGCSRVRA